MSVVLAVVALNRSNADDSIGGKRPVLSTALHPSTVMKVVRYTVTTMSTRKKTKRKTKVPAGYDSKLEYDLHKNELKGLNYHPEERIHYVTTHSYEPDFVTEICLEQDCSCTQRRRCGRSKTILVEVKGRFRERKEASKYIDIRKSLEESYEADCEWGEAKEKEVIFLFQDASKPMPFAQRRKDGTKQTHGEWAEKNKFRYYCLKKGLPKTWLTDLT